MYTAANAKNAVNEKGLYRAEKLHSVIFFLHYQQYDLRTLLLCEGAMLDP